MDLQLSYPGKKILIVDDEKSILDLMAIYLGTKGYVVTTALDGMTALALAKKSVPDLIITDVIMPHMDGYELYKELKSDTMTAEIPILILTAREKMEDSFMALGVQDFLAKPFTPENLWYRIGLIFQLGEFKKVNKIKESLTILSAEEYNKTERVAIKKQARLKSRAYKFQKEINIERIIVAVTSSSIFGVMLWGLIELPFWLDLMEHYETLRGSIPAAQAARGMKRVPGRFAPYLAGEEVKVLDGHYYEYDEEGNLRYEFFYEKGKLKLKKTYNDRGILVSIEPSFPK